MKPCVLLIEDDRDMRELVSGHLEHGGFDVQRAEDGIKGQALALQYSPDLIILDLMLPKVDGLTLCQRLRRDERTSGIPILMLTALGATKDKVSGFNSGADDYLTKPFDSEVLLAKIKNILNRKMISKSIEENSLNFEYEFGEFYFNSKIRELKYNNNPPIKLSPKENKLLELLVLNINDLLSRDVALNKIWRDDSYFTSRSMDVYIAKLRKYLSLDPNIEIINIHGEGFRLVIK